MKLKSFNNQEINLEKINIVCNSTGKNSDKVADMLIKLLEQYGHNYIKQEIKPNELPTFDKEATFAITIGGDGTFLSTARFYSEFDVPVLGLNFGHLGFLAQISSNKLKQGLDEITNGNFIIQKRLMLKADTSISKHKLYALNDIVIKGGAISRTARLFLSINGQEVCDYWQHECHNLQRSFPAYQRKQVVDWGNRFCFGYGFCSSQRNRGSYCV